MNDKFNALQQLGAGKFEHLHGSLIQHLEATYALLNTWHADKPLCDAGLYHAAYGTVGFESAVVELSQRTNIANIIGQSAENIVYLYCACDRDYVFKQLGRTANILFKDRFTQQTCILTLIQARQFCELTAANELELAISSEEFRTKHGKGLLSLLLKMKPFLSEPANAMVQKVLNST